jgi:hypothetical protein
LPFFGRTQQPGKPVTQPTDDPGSFRFEVDVFGDRLFAVQLVPIGADRDDENVHSRS